MAERRCRRSVSQTEVFPLWCQMCWAREPADLRAGPMWQPLFPGICGWLTVTSRVLEDQYASMKAWVGYMDKASKNDLWNTGFHFGDWLILPA